MSIIRSFFVRLIADALDHNLDWRLDALEQTVQALDTELSCIDGKVDGIESTLRDVDRTLDAIHADLPGDIELAESLVRIGAIKPDSDGPVAWRDSDSDKGNAWDHGDRVCHCGATLPDQGAELCQVCWDRWVSHNDATAADVNDYRGDLSAET